MAEETMTKPRAALFWAMVPVFLLGATLLGWGVMISIAVNDPSFSVEDRYYEKATHFDQREAELQASAELGFRANVQVEGGAPGQRPTLIVTLRDSGGAPVAGAALEAIAFFNARAANRQHLTLVEGAAGRYTAPFSANRRGLWEFRLRATRGSDVFVDRQRLEIGAVR